MTNLETQIDILGNFYLNYKDDKGIREFMEFNDIGLPLAFLTAEGLCEPTEQAIVYIQETFNMLLGTMGLEDIGFASLDHLLATAEQAGGPAAGIE
jgi:hypothetical protein